MSTLQATLRKPGLLIRLIRESLAGGERDLVSAAEEDDDA